MNMEPKEQRVKKREISLGTKVKIAACKKCPLFFSAVFAD